MREATIDELADNVHNLSFGDDRLGIMFYNDVTEDTAASLREGRKIFKNVEMVKIMIPGERSPTIRMVQKTGIRHSDDTMRWPKQWQIFKSQGEQVAHPGTPLNLWPRMPATLAEELKYINIFTVEQLAELADNYATKIPKGYEWKKQAADFVRVMKDSAVVAQLQEQLDTSKNEVEALKQAVKEQGEQIAALMAGKPRK
jgi:hypothetical protein